MRNDVNKRPKRPGDLAALLAATPPADWEWLQGTIGSVNIATGAVTVTLAGSISQTNCVMVGDVYSAVVGAQVLIARIRRRYFVLGPMKGNWPIGRGIVAFGQRDTTKTTANDNIEVGVMRLNTPLYAGRVYEVRVSGIRITGGGTNPHFLTTIRQNLAGNAVVGSTEIARSEGTTPTDTIPDMVALVMPGSSSVTGSFWYGLRRSGGTSTVQLQADNSSANLMTVTDLGLALTDTGVDL